MSAAPQQAAHHQQPMMMYNSAPKSNVRINYAATTSRAFGIIQIAGGILAIIFNAILIGILSAAGFSGAGIWCGILYILAGAFGYCAGRYKTTCTIVAYMVLSIIAAVFSIGIIVSSGIGPVSDTFSFRYRFSYSSYGPSSYYNSYSSYSPSYSSYSPSSYFSDRGDSRNWNPTPTQNPGMKLYNEYVATSITFNVLMILVALVEVITLIWGSVLTCKVFCCQQEQQSNYIAVPVQYINGQAVALVNPGNIQSVTNNYSNVQQPAVLPYNVLYPQQQQQIAPPMPLQFQPAGTQIPTASFAGNQIPPPGSQIPATHQEISETKKGAPDT